MARTGGAEARAPRWQRLDADARRAQILDCALRLFSERPYAAVSMAEIARCAGVQRGLLHHHFGDKHDLYVALVRDMLARFHSVLDDTAADVPTTPDGARSLDDRVAIHVDRWLDLVEEHADLWFALIDARAADRDTEVVGLVHRAHAAMIDGIVIALDLADAGPVARTVLWTYSGVAVVTMREWLRHGSLDRPQAKALLSSALVAMVRDVVPAVEAAGGAERSR